MNLESSHPAGSNLLSTTILMPYNQRMRFKNRILPSFLLAAAFLLQFNLNCLGEKLPGPDQDLFYQEPALVWDEALPLGNGLLGALVWGDGSPLNISLDRTDLWDLRPVPEFFSEEYKYSLMKEWVRQGKAEELKRLYEKPYQRPGPTKIPAGRIELNMEDAEFRESRLDLSGAVAEIDFSGGISAEVRVHSLRNKGLILVRGLRAPGKLAPRLAVPAFGQELTSESGNPEGVQRQALSTLEYDSPRVFDGKRWTGYLQEGWGGFRFSVVVAWRVVGENWIGTWSIATSDEGENPLQIAKSRSLEDLYPGFEASTSDRIINSIASHESWWKTFWDTTWIRIPNPVLEKQWYLETYKFGAATRPDTPPITLQGPWTADNGRIPPWKGDYHHDLNTELSYWPCYSGNRLSGGEGFVEWVWQTRDAAKAWTNRFFNLPGITIPMTADLNQEQIGGWHQYTHSATTGAWVAHHFYLHWRYSMDREFLTERAWPFIRDVAVFLEAVTEKGPDSKRTLRLSSSPEINDNRLEAWFPEITNYDLSLIRWIFQTASELALETGNPEDAEHWQSVLTEMPELWLDKTTGKLLISKDYPLPASHRHFSHLMAIHPLGLVAWENGPENQAVIRASLRELEEKGTDWWTGYSFSWLGNLAARARDGEAAEKALELFSTAFCLRNSFHVNGDQTGKGYSKFTYRPFTLEGNFAAAAGIQEMLIQSYSGTVRLLPAIPEGWTDLEFHNLRAEGAFLVSLRREAGQNTMVEVVAEKGGTLRLENPFGGEFRAEGAEVIPAVDEPGILVIQGLQPGQEITLKSL
jgi:alpha-L-fucosidase 2